MTEWREDLKIEAQRAGAGDRPLVFLFSDTQIAKEGFVEDINNMLNAGEVPNIGGGLWSKFGPIRTTRSPREKYHGSRRWRRAHTPSKPTETAMLRAGAQHLPATSASQETCRLAASDMSPHLFYSAGQAVPPHHPSFFHLSVLRSEIRIKTLPIISKSAAPSTGSRLGPATLYQRSLKVPKGSFFARRVRPSNSRHVHDVPHERPRFS